MKGHVHSIESFGTVDGPGIRMVIFLKGCPLRCLYCHNPDTWEMGGGTEMSVEEILTQYESSAHFYTGGGITVSGGEPLLQMDFVIELFESAKRRSIHTCIDTSGITFRPDNTDYRKKLDHLLAVTDLVLLDIKHIDPEEHRKLTRQENGHILEFARYLDAAGIPMWIRHVVVPGITDRTDDLYKLGQFIGTLKHVKALDVLPYHDMGKAKYEKLGLVYPLKDVAPMEKERAAELRMIIMSGIRDMKLG